MDRYCERCQTDLHRVLIRVGGIYPFLEAPMQGDIKPGARSDLSAYLCTSCGQIYLYADNPGAFVRED